jgi:hydroxypyruvate isomerase
MNRRSFLSSGALATAAATTGLAAGPFRTAHAAPASRAPFRMHYAPHLGMFSNHAGDDPVDQLEFMADEGFTAFEDNSMAGREVAVQEAMARAMQVRGLRMGVFVAHTIHWTEPTLTTGRDDHRERFLAEIRSSVDVARRVGATWMTVVPGYEDLRRDLGFQTASVVESLKRAAEILEPHGLVMVLEPLNPRDHPGLFLKRIPQAYTICKAVGSPACKILDDLYHQQVTEGNLIPNLDAAWDEIAYIQIGDNPGRQEPTTGEINYRNVFGHIHAKGFDGILGMEHGVSGDGIEGEKRLIQAYREVDTF